MCTRANRVSGVGKVEKGGSGVSLHLGFLTLDARSGPATAIRFDIRPHIPGSQETLCCPDAGVREHVQ